MCANHRNRFGDLYLTCEGRFLEIDSPTPPGPQNQPHPHQSPYLQIVYAVRAPCIQRSPSQHCAHPPMLSSVTVAHPPPMRSHLLPGRLRAIRPTLAGLCFNFCEVGFVGLSILQFFCLRSNNLSVNCFPSKFFRPCF